MSENPRKDQPMEEQPQQEQEMEKKRRQQQQEQGGQDQPMQPGHGDLVLAPQRVHEDLSSPPIDVRRRKEGSITLPGGV